MQPFEDDFGIFDHKPYEGTPRLVCSNCAEELSLRQFTLLQEKTLRRNGYRYFCSKACLLEWLQDQEDRADSNNIWDTIRDGTTR